MVLGEAVCCTTLTHAVQLTSRSCVRPTKARALYAAGCRSLDDLKKPEFVSKLTASSRTSLEFVGDLERPVTRNQAEKARVSARSKLIVLFALLVGWYSD